MLTHHAFLYLVDKLPDSPKCLLGSEFAGCEVEEFVFANFGINDARNLIEKSYLLPNSGSYRLNLVVFDQITREAEQALLKITEEPPQTTKFVFIIPRRLNLLPTLLSRFVTVSLGEPDEQKDSLETFLELTIGEKLELVTKKQDSKDQLWLEEIRSGLQKFLVKNLKKLDVSDVQALNFVLSNLGKRGSSNKMLLEELALTLEQLKEKL